MLKVEAKKFEITEAPGKLSFRRRMETSDALMYSGIQGVDGLNRKPLVVTRQGLRGTQNFIKEKADRKVDNVQVADVARLDPDARYLIVEFDVKFLPLLDCIQQASFDGPRTRESFEKDQHYREALLNFMQTSLSNRTGREVASRYARNILNGRWLWRNRSIAQDIEINVTCPEGLDIIANAFSVPVDSFGRYSDKEKALADQILLRLSGQVRTAIKVCATLDMGLVGPTQVYPSEEFLDGAKPTGLSRVLYVIDRPLPAEDADRLDFGYARVRGRTALRDTKVANALRTIDTWYDDFDRHGKPISVEPQGANMTANYAFRHGKDMGSSFELSDRVGTLKPGTAPAFFFLASLIRGGVYAKPTAERVTKPKKDTSATDTQES